MFEHDFYPTPQNVIEDILSGVNIINQTILEPSAGSGNIVSYLKNAGAKEVIACEIDPKLRRIVERECRVIKDDFLQVSSDEISHINTIVMNPPFSKQEEHILHAWDVAPAGCQIVSICNDSMLSNRYSQDRKRIKELVDTHGRDEYLGDVFASAERKTGVKCSVIYLFKPAGEDNDFSEFFDLSEEYENSSVEGVIRYDFIRDIVNRYVGAIKLYDDVLKNGVAMNDLVGEFLRGEKLTFTCTIENAPTNRETFRKELQKTMWHHIFNKMDMQKYVTKGVQDDINKFVEQQTHVPFTMKNIYTMIHMIVGTHGSRMNKVLIEAFENICSYSHQNSTAGEKWKTNSDYMVNKKFIIPYIAEGYSWGRVNPYVKIGHHSHQKIDDVQKALCHLMGKQYNHANELCQFVHAKNLEWGKWHVWGFFKVRFYKKSTAHFEFLDENVWMQFNLEVAKAKGWRLPTAKKEKKKKQASSQTPIVFA